ncbi:MAG: glycosyltransferase family 39 protein, partial [Desulfobulbaceae bacterium]|nr:glycosyltransferase family 39 protein [Desulfobulbaceae bacterium]
LLSKYHAVLLPLCLFCYLLASPGRRFWLGRVQPYAAGLIALLVFLPNILWNAEHNWVSYAFQLSHGGGGHFTIGKLLAVLGGQMGVWSPVIFGLLIAAFISMARKRPLSESDRFVLWTSLPVFLFFCGIGTFGKILPHWPSVGWWTGSLAVISVTLGKFSKRDKAGIRWRRWCITGAIVGFVMTGFLYLALFLPVVDPIYSRARDFSIMLNRHFPAITRLEPFKSQDDITNILFGWDKIAKRVEEIRSRMPNPEKTFVFCHRFYTTSRIAVYVHPETQATTLRNKFNQYGLWFSAEGHRGWDALFVVEDRAVERSKRYMPLFQEMDPEPVKIEVFRKGQIAHALSVFRYYGFKGKYEEK